MKQARISLFSNTVRAYEMRFIGGTCAFFAILRNKPKNNCNGFLPSRLVSLDIKKAQVGN